MGSWNPMGILAGVIALVLAWALVGQVREGAISVRSGGRRTRIRRDANPQLFWLLTAVYAAVILYIASFAFTA